MGIEGAAIRMASAHNLVRTSPVHDLRNGGSPPPVYFSPPVYYTTNPAPSWDKDSGPNAKWPVVASAFPQRVHSPVCWTYKDLRGATLRGLDLHDGNLQQADLRGVDLTGADLEGADLRDAKLDVEACWQRVALWSDRRSCRLEQHV